MIYFDNAATTFPKPEVVYKALDKANRELAFNAGRGHYELANHAFHLIEDTRKFLCEKANAKGLIFTPSATHAVNQIVAGLNFQSGDVVYCSIYDHNAIARTLHAYAKKLDFTVKLIPVKQDNSIDLEKFKFDCTIDKPKAIFATHVSNVTGYILPVEEIGKIAKNVDSLFIVDGAQAFGLVPVNLNEMNIDYYVFAGHKTLNGPFGIAGYFVNGKELAITFYGGTGTDSLNLEMPNDIEPSSPNVVAIAGLLEASKWTFDKNVLSHEIELYEYALAKLQLIDGIKIYNNEKLSYVGIISFNIDGYSSEDLSDILAKDYDIYTRGGYHCCPYIHYNLDTINHLGTVRISFNFFNSKEEIDRLIFALEEIIYES